MFILMMLFLIIGVGLIGYTFFQWFMLSQFLFRDLVALQKLLVMGCIGLILFVVALFKLF